ncbi:hypothetical protein BFJ65_g1748 [Fusarium oxysporum f. sp. cepae]|uniref:Major facilitator superfamily (MFS) profile domain-containing protein n=1 Tax=Fusarium oxysporum f. sp. cepae TaxID=396571 RepID=A0A3L6P7I5_FUSOX|nr:hypothetical protein BFJ65_g1748 [Fusarium oxysporum f. sp. cepae]
MRRLLTSSTFETTVQVIGACTTVCLVVANITLATNQPPAEWNQMHMMDHEALKLRPFVFFTIGSTLVMWGIEPLSILIPLCFSCGVLTFAWLACTKVASFVVFTALYGFFSGGYVSILPATVASFAPSPGVAGTWLGMVLFCISFAGLTGTPITGAILDRAGTSVTPGYWGLCAFGGSSLFIGTCFLLLARWLK